MPIFPKLFIFPPIICEIPWEPTSKWKSGDWYPLPVGYMARNQKEYIIDGWGIFERDGDSVDILPVDTGKVKNFTFTTALAICEEHNKRSML